MGKTLEIDESTRFKLDFVRVKIACRDVYEVPESAEGNLGLNIFDFFFELEESEHMKKETQKGFVEVSGAEGQPSAKKMKMAPEGQSSGKGQNVVNPVLQNYGSGDKGIQSASFTPVQSKFSYSAPGKINSTKSFPSSTSDTLETAPQADIEDEAIPAATYQPGGELSEDDDSASSEDFEKSVHQMLDKGKKHFLQHKN